jgi:uncharacterized protein YutE (UPF0331/DUF86 family)
MPGRETVGEHLLRKLVLCRERVEKIRSALPDQAEDVLKDERLEAFIAFNLFLLVQDAVDLAAHLVAERGLGIAGSLRETFQLLSNAGLISTDSATAMGALASLRNRIARTYGGVDPVRMVRETPAGLSAVSRFLAELIENTEPAPLA